MWRDARIACDKKGMSLASLDTREKRQMLYSVLERRNFFNSAEWFENSEYSLIFFIKKLKLNVSFLP